MIPGDDRKIFLRTAFARLNSLGKQKILNLN